MRRVQILKETLAERQAPARVVEHWVLHTLSLRAHITDDEGGQCK